MSVATPTARRRLAKRPTARRPEPQAPASEATVGVQPEGWREFVGHWLEGAGCSVQPAARGDWEIELSVELKRLWRRQRVRLVFDPQRPTLPRGAWFMAPASTAGRKLLEVALESPAFARRTALAHVPGAPDSGLASVCRVRGLTWGTARLGPVRYERRVSAHAVVTRWGGMPWQEPWVVLLGAGGEFMEWDVAHDLPDLRTREGLYQIAAPLSAEERAVWIGRAREHLDRLIHEREAEWHRTVSRLCDAELERLGAFFSSRIEEEEDRQRRRGAGADESEVDSSGDSTSLKLEWERRAAEVRQRWAMRTEVRLWGLVEWSWPVADLEQELRAGAVRVRLQSRVDVARGRPELPGCPGCGSPAEMLVRVRGSIGCSRCA